MTKDPHVLQFPAIQPPAVHDEQAESRPTHLKAVVVPGMGGQFEAKLVAPGECILRIEAARAWFDAEELAEFERMVTDAMERKQRKARPKLLRP